MGYPHAELTACLVRGRVNELRGKDRTREREQEKERDKEVLRGDGGREGERRGE